MAMRQGERMGFCPPWLRDHTRQGSNMAVETNGIIIVPPTETVPPAEFGRYFLDNARITPDWLEEFWGMKQNEYKKVPELAYKTHGQAWGNPTYDLVRNELTTNGKVYRADNEGVLYSHDGKFMDRGRFFAWMWSQGYLPEGWKL